MPKALTLITGPHAAQTARRRARYGHRNWIVWVNRGGVTCAAPASADTLKRAILDTGTQGLFYLYSKDGTTFSSSSFRIAVTWFKNARAGYFV
jgi:hypothetical protein